jgi:zinc transporter ZupT
MGWLIATLVSPLVGPALYRAFHDRPRAVELVDGFVYVAVPLLVAWQVLPHAWETRSAGLLLALGSGFLVPALVERASHVLADRTDNVALVVGLSGLALHAMLEGAAFIPTTEPPGVAFGLAVTLHRIPVSLVIWWLICPRYGSVWSALGVGSIVLATLIGYLVGTGFVGGLHGGALELYQAFVSGSLVHVVFHQGRHDHDHDHEAHHDHA